MSSSKIVFVSGNFNILHPGHLRFLKFAAEQGNKLVVGLLAKGFSEGAFLEDVERTESLQAVSFVDDVVLVKADLNYWIRKLEPAYIVKGREFENQFNAESEIIKEFGGRILFGSGEPVTATSTFVNENEVFCPIDTDYKALAYLKRHKISSGKISSLLEGYEQIKVAVLGDTIVDEYVECDPVGMSREDATIVVSPRETKKFLGGGGIVAAHAAGLGATVDFYTVLGDDDNASYVKAKASEFGFSLKSFVDGSRPTTCKRRYRAGDKTMLRVNTFRQHDIPSAVREGVFDTLTPKLNEYDLILFSDFSYGFLSDELMANLLPEISNSNTPFVADSQSSSQVGDLSKFKGANLVTPTEYEARQTIKNNNDGLIKVSEGVGNFLNTEHVFVTQGADGVLVRTRNRGKGWWDTDDLPALNSSPKDVAGAGDAMMTASALALCSGADIWQAAFIGSVASALQVSRTGNIPLEFDTLNAQFSAFFEAEN